MDWHGLILSVAAKGCSALALRMGSCAVRGQVMVLAMLLETVFWHVESGLSWKPRRWVVTVLGHQFHTSRLSASFMSAQLRSKLDGTLPTSISRATMIQNNCESSPYESWSTGTQLVV
jgi:hypothetical protein